MGEPLRTTCHTVHLHRLVVGLFNRVQRQIGLHLFPLEIKKLTERS